MNNKTREASVEIAATPARVWQAITDAALTRQYYFDTDILSAWTPGARWTSEADGHLYLEGEVLEVEPERRLVQTFHVVDEEPANADPPSRVTWLLTRAGDGTLLRIVHEDQPQATLDYTEGGWEHILAGLKVAAEGGA